MAGLGESGTWFEADGDVGRIRGLAFKFACLGATVLALSLMLVFLLYVANDALQPFSADVTWWAVYGLTVGVPVFVFMAYYVGFDRRSGEVAYTAFGIPIVATVVAGGVTILFRHLITPREWFALAVALVVSAIALELHARARTATALERSALVVLVPWIALVGIPAITIDRSIQTLWLEQELGHLSVSTPEILPSLWSVLLSLPVLPSTELSLLCAFTLPIAAAAAWHVERVRAGDRLAPLLGGATVVVAASGLLAASLVGLSPIAWIILVTVVGVPVALYVESIVRRDDGVVGLVFPVFVCVGVVLGTAIVDVIGAVGPNTWLDWAFLNSAHSRTPVDAGIYPPLVGSILMLIVVALAAFPIGIGAAIYLEEYAPSQGWFGGVVELIEINIANLAGVPSVVYGVLGLTLFVRTIELRSGIVLVGGLTIALLILPIVIVSAQEAIRAVPDSLRQASFGMGATKWQTTRNVVLPRALPGIMTGTILSLGRAIGETAPLLMIGAAAVVRLPPESFMSKFSAMPRQILRWSKEIQYDFRYGVLAAGVLTLLCVLLMMNGTAILIRNKYD